MLHKMYLVPAEDFRPYPFKRPLPRQRPISCRLNPTMLHPHTELRTKHREDALQRNAWTKEIAYYMIQIMPAATIPQSPTTDIQLSKPKAKSRSGTQTDDTTASFAADTYIRPPKEIIYETPKREPVLEDDDDDEFVEEDVKRFGRENVGPVASPYLMLYVYKRVSRHTIR